MPGGDLPVALKAVVTEEEFSSLPAPIKAEYSEADSGKRQLQVTSVEGFELADNSKLKSALQKEKTAASEAAKKLKSFEGLDAEAAREALKKIEEFAGMDPEAKAKEHLEVLKKQLTDKFENDQKGLTKKYSAEVEAAKARGDKFAKKLQTSMLDAIATKAIVDAKGHPDLLLSKIREEVRLKEDGDDFKIEFVDANGDVRPSTKAGSLEPMTVAERVAEMKNDNRFARAFDGTGASGSGASGSDGNNGKAPYVINPADARDYQKFSAAEKAAKAAGRELVIQ
jgi:hypothetical protein